MCYDILKIYSGTAMDTELQRKILIVDAESAARPFCDYFAQIGYSAFTAETIADARRFLLREKADAVISELRLPDGEAGDLYQESSAPVIVFSEETSDEAVIRALSLGAADYIFKPCSPPVMAARLERRLCLRSRSFTGYGITLNVAMRTALYDGKPLKLTSSEFNILCFLMAHPGQFFTADTIYERVWKMPSMQTSVVRFHISNLKRTIFSVTGKNLILSGFGTGYAFASED